MVAAISQTQFMHLCICKNLPVILTGDRVLHSITRWWLTYLFFPLVPILSALIDCLGMHLETHHRALTLWCSEMGVGGCRQKHFLFKLEWQWGKVRRRLIRNNKAYTHDPMGKLQFSSLLSFLFLTLLLFSWGLPSLRYGVFFLLYYIA